MAEGRAREGFDIDLSYGGIREDAFANILFKAQVEVKAQDKARETGNVFIEFRQHGRKSGIAVTTAQFWAMEYDKDCWIVMPTERLKRIARRVYEERRKNKRKGGVMGGDNNNYEGVLVPVIRLISRLEPVPDEE